MRVLILSGSPRVTGNSSLLCDEFARGAREAGHEVEKINAARKKVAGCLGCDACKRSGGICVQKDDMGEIREKMIAADVIVLASPIYYYSICAQLKLVIDRTYAFFPELKGKTFYYLFTCAAPAENYTKTMIASLDGFTCCLPDSKVAGIIMGLGAMAPGDIKNGHAMADAYQMGLNIEIRS